MSKIESGNHVCSCVIKCESDKKMRDRRWGGYNERERDMLSVGHLLADESVQDVEDQPHKSGVHGQGLDDGPHEQRGKWALLHQLLHHHRQHRLPVDCLLAEAQVGR